MILILLIFVLLILFFEFKKIDVNLDSNATTIPHCAVLKAMNKAAYLGNPSAYWAKDAEKIVQELKIKLLQVCGKSFETHECIITSGCSESNNLILRGFSGNIFISGFEHGTSIDCARDLKNIKIIHGWPEAAKYKPEPGDLVSVMAVNNETGDIFDIGAISKKCRQVGAYFHSDITQLLGKLESPEILKYCDAISGSAHKIHGPTGIGFLIMPKDMPVRCQISGTQNNHLRGGTYNVSGCAGFKIALDITLKDRVKKNKKLREHCEYLWQQLQTCWFDCSLYIVRITRNSYNTLMVSFQHKTNKICNIALRKYLTNRGVKVSIGSACQVNQAGASHVLHELNLPYKLRAGCIRFSVSDYTTKRDINYLINCLQDLKNEITQSSR